MPPTATCSVAFADAALLLLFLLSFCPSVYRTCRRTLCSSSAVAVSVNVDVDFAAAAAVAAPGSFTRVAE